MSAQGTPTTAIQGGTRTARLLETAGGVATFGAMIIIVEICREMLAADSDTGWIRELVLTAVAIVVAGLAAQILGRALSRRAAARSQELLRAGVANRLRVHPAARQVHAAWRADGASMGGDIATAGRMVGRAGSELVSTVLVFLLSIGYLFWVDWRMALVTILPILLGFVAFGVVSARFFKEMKDDYVAAISGIDEVRPTIGLDARINRAGSRARTAMTTRIAARRLTEATDGFSDFFLARIGTLLGGRAMAEIAFSPLSVLVFVLCGGSLMIRSGSLAPADLVPFLLVGAGLAAPLLASSYFMEEIGEGKKAVARLTGFAAGGPAGQSGDSTTSGPVPGLEPPGPGELLTVIEPAPEGADRVTDLITAAVPAEQFTSVGAEPAVVTGAVGAYITADRAEGTPEAAERAARLVGVHDTIAAFPRGYASVVGAELSLSYPEIQRIALARVVAGEDRGVVLLDQRAFSGDPDVLVAAVADLRERAAVVIVSCGPPVVTDGKVVVMDAGEVAESGTHEELIRAGGRYAALSAAPPGTERAAVPAVRSATSEEIH